jgi:hypothetical protein
MSRDIDRLLEGLETGAAIGVEEPLLAAPLAQIDLDQLVDGLGHAVRRQGGAEDLADLGVLGAGAAKGQLIEFLALLIDAQRS